MDCAGVKLCFFGFQSLIFFISGFSQNSVTIKDFVTFNRIDCYPLREIAVILLLAYMAIQRGTM